MLQPVALQENPSRIKNQHVGKGFPERGENGSELLESRLCVCLLAACPFPANHGTPGSIREMSEALVERGHQVHIVTYHHGEEIPMVGPRIHRIPAWKCNTKVVVGPTKQRPLCDLLMVFKTLQVIRDYRPQIIHAHGYEASLVAGVCRVVTGLPIVYSGHNTMSDELASFDFIRPRWLADCLAKFLDAVVPRIADRCIPHSESLERFFRRRGVLSRTEPVINFGIKITPTSSGNAYEIRSRHGLTGPLVMYAGVMDQFQRIDLLLEAMVSVVKAESHAQLMLVVTIPSEKNIRRIRQQAETLGIADRIVFTKPVELDGVREYLQACDVFVIPRPNAPGFPIKLLNTMLAAKPCVMFSSSASGLTDRKHALLVGENTSSALAEGIINLLGNPELCESLGENGFKFLLENHDRRKTAQKVCEAYFRTLAARSKWGTGPSRSQKTPSPRSFSREIHTIPVVPFPRAADSPVSFTEPKKNVSS